MTNKSTDILERILRGLNFRITLNTILGALALALATAAVILALLALSLSTASPAQAAPDSGFFVALYLGETFIYESDYGSEQLLKFTGIDPNYPRRCFFEVFRFSHPWQSWVSEYGSYVFDGHTRGESVNIPELYCHIDSGTLQASSHTKNSPPTPPWGFNVFLPSISNGSAIPDQGSPPRPYP